MAVLKKSGVDFPPLEDMKNCFEKNKDGAGFMFAQDGKVHYFKGIMTWENFAELYPNLIGTVGKDGTCIMHFRIATHGARDATMTHPFPCSNNPEDLKSTMGTTEVGLVHNGIISAMPNDKDLSDTAVLVRDYLYPMVKAKLDLEARNRILDILRASSRIATMNGDGEIHALGSWTTEANGVMYSNDLWKPTPVRTTPVGAYGGHYGAFDDDYSGWNGRYGGYHGYGARSAATKEWNPVTREFETKKHTPTGQALLPIESHASQTTNGTKAKKQAKKRARNSQFETYTLSLDELNRIVPLDVPVTVGGVVLNPFEAGNEDLFVLDGFEVFQMWAMEAPTFLKVGELDNFGSNFADPESFLEYLKENGLLGVA